jgi:3-hydroxyacyl-CoA dehydrogenase
MFSFDSTSDPSALNAWALNNVVAPAPWIRQDAAWAGKSLDVRPIRSVGIIGAGTMGAEIAAAEIEHNLPVTIFDNNPDALATIARRAWAELSAGGNGNVARSSLDRLLRATTDLSEAAKCDLIIESIVETLPAKRELFGRLSELPNGKAILASNTSTIPIGKLAGSLTRPERFCGLHFCHPVCERPLVEIVRGTKTGDETIAALAAHARTIDKLPVVVADGPGFLVNRLLLPYLTEALELVMDGVSIGMVETAALEFGMAKGPFRMMDEIGLDTTLQAGWCMAAAFPHRIPVSPLLVALIKQGRLGQKTGAGFFSYTKPASEKALEQTASEKGTVPFSLRENRDSPQSENRDSPQSENRDSPQSENRDSPQDVFQVDPATVEIIGRWVKKSAWLSAESIVLRLFLPMVLEATRIIEDGVAGNLQDIDLCAVFGLGFPAWRGGPLWWADSIKPAAIVEMLRPLEPLGARWRPTRLLMDLAAKGRRFY